MDPARLRGKAAKSSHCEHSRRRYAARVKKKVQRKAHAERLRALGELDIRIVFPDGKLTTGTPEYERALDRLASELSDEEIEAMKARSAKP